MPEMLIGGEWRQAAAHEQLEVVNPATEAVLDTVPAAGTEDVGLAVATAKQAFKEWSRTDVEARAAILIKAATLISLPLRWPSTCSRGTAARSWRREAYFSSG